MEIPLRVLIVEDSKEDAELLVAELRRGGFDPTIDRVDTLAALTSALNQSSWDMVLSDYTLPGFTGMDALFLVRKRGLDLPFIFVSGTIGEDAAVAAMRAGAQDYIMKNNLKRLYSAVERQLHETALRRERKRAEETIQYLAYHDILTDLPNRTLFGDRLRQAILTCHRKSEPLALLVIDLNRFKEINDAFGHHYGDLLLRQLGPRLGECLRDYDTIARIGGDEFAVLLPNSDAQCASMIAQRILSAVEIPFILKEAIVEIGASIGVAFYPDHGEESEILFQRADTAMYVAKQTGGGYGVYSPEHEKKSPLRLTLLGKLRRAIEQGELTVYYQPQLSLKTNQIIGFEALSRWPHPQLGFIPPDEFITLAEETGLIKPFTQWVLQSVCDQCKVWRAAGVTLPVSVNLSARNLLETQLPDQVAELIRTGWFQPGLLEFEITESTFMANPLRAMEVLTDLHAAGIPLAIDDFGAGYSSLAYLKRLPVQKIKIDKTFIMDRLEDEADRVIVHSIIQMGHHLGLEVIAEGVQDQSTKDRLEVLGCDAIQGYHVSYPLPSTELTRWLEESPWKMKEQRS